MSYTTSNTNEHITMNSSTDTTHLNIHTLLELETIFFKEVAKEVAEDLKRYTHEALTYTGDMNPIITVNNSSAGIDDDKV